MEYYENVLLALAQSGANLEMRSGTNYSSLEKIAKIVKVKKSHLTISSRLINAKKAVEFANMLGNQLTIIHEK